MKRTLKTQLSLGFAAIILLTVALISLVSTLLITREFQNYTANQQEKVSKEIADSLAMQYDGETGWNVDYIHGLGMYALSDGFIVKVYDKDGEVIWDAESHDMEYCHQVMQSILDRMDQLKSKNGQFLTHSYLLESGAEEIGRTDITYYTPYYFDDNAFDFVRSLNLILLVLGVVFLAAAVAAGVLFAGRIAKPIIRVKETADLIAEGNYSSRAECDVKTLELNRLAASINHMAEQIERQETLRKQLTSDVAHELRTPLANVSAQLEMVLDGVFEPTQERLKEIYDEVARLSALVSDLERLQQVENSALEKTQTDLLLIVNSAVRLFSQEFAKRRIECVVEGESVPLAADENRLKQVVVNLLSNAVKYSDDGGTIRVKAFRKEGNAVLSVSDDGIGIPAEEQALIFERFYRTDKTRSKKTGGAGIGLAIVSAVVKAHGGTVEVSSGEGRGSTFTVTLPCEKGVEE